MDCPSVRIYERLAMLSDEVQGAVLILSYEQM